MLTPWSKVCQATVRGCKNGKYEQHDHFRVAGNGLERIQEIVGDACIWIYPCLQQEHSVSICAQLIAASCKSCAEVSAGLTT